MNTKIDAIKVRETLSSLRCLDEYASGRIWSIVSPSKAPHEKAKRTCIITPNRFSDNTFLRLRSKKDAMNPIKETNAPAHIP